MQLEIGLMEQRCSNIYLGSWKAPVDKLYACNVHKKVLKTQATHNVLGAISHKEFVRNLKLWQKKSKLVKKDVCLVVRLLKNECQAITFTIIKIS